MKPKQYDYVKLSNGISGAVIEIFNGGERPYMVEYATPDGPDAYDQIFVSQDEIVEITGNAGD